ncbi:MAG: FkbM family methyltransferase [bacterium]
MLPIVTLNSVCEKYSLPIPEIVKIDAEGLDLEVVKGAQNLIGKTEVFFFGNSIFRFLA